MALSCKAEKIRTVLVGIGGFGNYYVNAVLDHGSEMGIELVGTVDTAPDSCKRYAEVIKLCGQSFPSLENFFETSDVDLVVITTPINLHESMSVSALEHGATVLCEKPAAGSIQEGLAMSRASKLSNRSLLIGYQWSFSDTILQLQQRIRAGEFGKCRSARILGLWPRGSAYFSRNNWAGKLRTDKGEWILDSPLNNALAHYAHNPLFILEQEPVTVEAELYRVNPIESFDTVALRSTLSGGTELIFCASLAVPAFVGPMLHYEFESCTVIGRESGVFAIHYNDGRIENLPPINASPPGYTELKLQHAVSVARGDSEPCCDIDASIPQIRLVAGAHLSGSIREIPDFLHQKTDDITWAQEVQDALTVTFATGLLPNETANYSWTSLSKKVSVEGLTEFSIPEYEE